MLYRPFSVAADAVGNVFVGGYDTRVRKIDQAGTISTVGSYPTRVTALAFDEDGNLYVGSQFRVFKVPADGGATVAIAGTGDRGFSGDGGPADLASLSVGGIAVDPWGNVWVVDQLSRRIRVLEPIPTH